MDQRRSYHVLAVLPAAVALAALLAAAGCSRNEQAPPRDQKAREAPPADRPQTPYHYGLIDEYRNMLAEDPHNIAAVIGLANALFDAGQWKQAIHYYERALRFNPHLTDVITDMGTCYRNLAAPDKAIELYNRTLAIEPTHQNALFNLGMVYGFDKKEYARAIGYWEQLLHVAPKHPKADYLQANIAKFRQLARSEAGR